MKKVLITGATGFLGKYVVDEFADDGWEVTAFGRNEKVGNSLITDNVRFVKGDLASFDEISAAIEGNEYVIHCGAMSTTWGRWKDFYSANVIGTENVARACIDKNVKKLVYVSSPSIYTSKEDRFNIKEDNYDETNELNYYIKSKIMSEKKLAEIAKDKLSYNIIRPRGLVGVGDTSIIPRLLRAGQNNGIPLLNNGCSIVDMTSVENVAYALRLCTIAENNDGAVYNITNGEPMEFKVLLDRFFKEMEIQPKYKEMNFARVFRVASVLEKFYLLFNIYDKSPIITRYLACMLAFSQTLDISKARKELNYEPQVTLEESIIRYAKNSKI